MTAPYQLPLDGYDLAYGQLLSPQQEQLGIYEGRAATYWEDTRHHTRLQTDLDIQPTKLVILEFNRT